jgi:hypothetical protein
MQKMLLLGAILGLSVISSACGSNPLMPSETRTETVSYQQILAQLAWNEDAPGCVVRRPVPIPDNTQFRHLWRENDSLDVEWRLNADYTISANFRADAGLWKLCEWDTTNN